MEDALIAYRTTTSQLSRLPIPAHAVAIIESVMRHHGVSLWMACQKRRRAPDEVVAARDEAIYVARSVVPECSWGRLAKFFNRDHASLVSGARRFERLMAVDELLRARVDRAVGASRAEARVA
jgi:chromosomal replication initiation ATPase DnaA